MSYIIDGSCIIHCCDGDLCKSECNKATVPPSTLSTTLSSAGSPCHTNPCKFGVCKATNSSFECTCIPGYTGPTCDVSVTSTAVPTRNPCFSNPCVFGYCSYDTVSDMIACSCLLGAHGRYCENGSPVSPATTTTTEAPLPSSCLSNPCVRGRCIDIHRTYFCSCEVGYSGINCDIKESPGVTTQQTTLTPCTFNPCLHGRCLNHADNTYTCTCYAGYTGVDCSVVDSTRASSVSSFLMNFCESNPCVNGICVEEVGSYSCQCDQRHFGHNCEFKFSTTSSTSVVTSNPCFPNPCISGTCLVNLDGTYSCVCEKGYSGTNCETNSPEVMTVPVAMCDPDPCEHGICFDLRDSYQCVCDDNYYGFNCDHHYTHVDPCSPNPCVNGSCTEVSGTFQCDCYPGYTGLTCAVKSTTTCTYKRLKLLLLRISYSIRS